MAPKYLPCIFLAWSSQSRIGPCCLQCCATLLFNGFNEWRKLWELNQHLAHDGINLLLKPCLCLFQASSHFTNPGFALCGWSFDIFSECLVPAFNFFLKIGDRRRRSPWESETDPITPKVLPGMYWNRALTSQCCLHLLRHFSLHHWIETKVFEQEFMWTTAVKIWQRRWRYCNASSPYSNIHVEWFRFSYAGRNT